MRSVVSIAAAVALLVAALSLLDVLPIRADRRMPAGAPVSIDPFELMTNATDLPAEQIEDLF